MRAAKRIRPTKAQRMALVTLKKRLAEMGYLVADVARKYRRHVSDFVIIPKGWPQQFAIVRIAPHSIVIRPFGVKRNDIMQKLPGWRRELHVSISYAMPQLRYVKNKTDLWRHFVDPKDHATIELLQPVRCP